MSHRRTSPKVFSNARELRHHQTEVEGILWQGLRSHRLNDTHIRRQHAIGPYIVDFCATRRKIIIELDGGQHVDQQAYDAERTAYLESKGYRVLRFWNNEVIEHRDAVLLVILGALGREEKS